MHCRMEKKNDETELIKDFRCTTRHGEIKEEFNYHFQVALNFAGLVRAQTQFAVNVELAQIGVVLGNLSRAESRE